MTWKSWEDAAEHGPGRFGVKLGLAALLLVVVLGGVTCVLNPFCQAGRIMSKTLDADNVLYNYEWFKQRYQDIDAVDAKVRGAHTVVGQFADMLGDRKDWKRDDRIEWSRLNSVWLGLTQQRNDLAAEYNARANMANRSIFKAGDLPDSISIEGEMP